MHRRAQAAHRYQALRPSNSSDWKQLRSVGLYLLVIVVAVCVLFFLKNRTQRERVEKWQSASAVVQDARTVGAVQVESNRGGAMLYNVEVLAKYDSDGATRERWIVVQQLPEPLAEAQLQIFRWKGKTCLIRWNPANKDQAVAELS